MAKYTIELRKVCDIYGRNVVESWFKDYNLQDFLTSSQITTINNAGIWTKDKLATKIVDNFYMREIGFETPALFENRAKAKMNTIMDKYLLLIYSNSLTLNPLQDINVNSTESRTINNTNASTLSSTSASTNTNSSSGLQVNSNTPQGQISKSGILSGDYASSTSAVENTGSSSINDTSSSNTSGTNNTSESVTKSNVGNNRSQADLLLQYRKTILNIDEMIMKELNDLFFGLW